MLTFGKKPPTQTEELDGLVRQAQDAAETYYGRPARPTLEMGERVNLSACTLGVLMGELDLVSQWVEYLEYETGRGTARALAAQTRLELEFEAVKLKTQGTEWVRKVAASTQTKGLRMEALQAEMERELLSRRFWGLTKRKEAVERVLHARTRSER